MKKLIIVFFVLTCATNIFAAKVPLPKWFTEIPENEYVGVSEPGGDKNQAITMALLQYMFANHAKGVSLSGSSGQISSETIGSVEHITLLKKKFHTCSFADTISYDVLEAKELSTGEIICRITAGQSQQTPISVFYQDSSEDFSERYGEYVTYKSEGGIQASIQSNLGDWIIKIYYEGSHLNEDGKYSWESLFQTKDDTAQFYYQPKDYETQYVERKVTPTGEEIPSLGISPYSICDNLLAAYKHLLIDVNSLLADDAIKHYYNGECPSYSLPFHDQEFPIVLQTSIKGISLYKKELDTTFPVIFYSTNEKYSPSDSLYVKTYIDQKVKDNILPPFSECAKNYIEPEIIEWQKKREFETTSAWQERVSEPNRQEVIENRLSIIKREYLTQYAKRQHLEFTLGTYDSDHEVYLVKEATLGDILIPVPLDDAPYFKQNWEGCKFTPHYEIMGREAGVSSIDFTFSSGKVFTYKADTTLVYSSEEIQYNFSPLDIPLIGQSPIQNLATNLFNQSINKIVITTPFDLTPMSSVLVSYKNIFGKYEMPDKDVRFPYVVIRVTLSGSPQLVHTAKQSLALDLGQSYITEQTVPMEDKILFLVPTGVKSIYLTDGNGQRQLIYSGRLIPNKIYDGTIKVQ